MYNSYEIYIGLVATYNPTCPIYKSISRGFIVVITYTIYENWRRQSFDAGAESDLQQKGAEDLDDMTHDVGDNYTWQLDHKFLSEHEQYLVV